VLGVGRGRCSGARGDSPPLAGAAQYGEGGGRDSNPRPPGPQPGALPTELPPPSGHSVARKQARYPLCAGPVAQRTERQPSKLRAEVRFLPGPCSASRSWEHCEAGRDAIGGRDCVATRLWRPGCLAVVAVSPAVLLDLALVAALLLLHRCHLLRSRGGLFRVGQAAAALGGRYDLPGCPRVSR
jgi:hypothetical protein